MLKNSSDSFKRGSGLLVGMMVILVISGLVIVSHMLMLSQAKNIDDFAEHQAAIYASRSGIASVQYYIQTFDDSKIPLTQDQSISFVGMIKNNNYYVTVTRKSATSTNLIAPITEEDMVGVYNIVSSGVENDSAATYSAVIDVNLSTGYSLGLNKAIITEGDIDLQGNPDVLGGTLADVHTNSNGFIQNGVIVEGEFDAVGTLDIQGTVSIGGSEIADPVAYETAHSGATYIDLPTVTASAYEHVADFKLISTGSHIGEVYEKSTGNYYSASSKGWKYTNGGGWSLENNGNPPEGFYFVEGDISLNQNLGTSEDPFNISIATTGSFTMNGSSSFAPYEEDLAVLADVDIGVNGNADASYNGIFLAHEQIDFSGNSTTVGMLISTGVTSNSNVAQITNVLTGTTDFTAGTGLLMPHASAAPILTEDLLQLRKSNYDEQSDNFRNFSDMENYYTGNFEDE